MPAGYPQTAYAPQAGYNPQMGMHPGVGMQMSPQQIQQMGLRQAAAAPVPMAAPGGPGVIPAGGHLMYNQPNVPEYAWPSYAAYDNTAAVTYPSQYDASAFPTSDRTTRIRRFRWAGGSRPSNGKMAAGT